MFPLNIGLFLCNIAIITYYGYDDYSKETYKVVIRREMSLGRQNKPTE
jgi:hypothetical protein